MKKNQKLKSAILKYVKFTKKHVITTLTREESMDYSVLGIISEIGEIADALKRHLSSGEKLDEENILEEIGDFLWFKCLHLRVIGYSDDEICCKIYNAVYTTESSIDSKFLSGMTSNKFDVIISLVEVMFANYNKNSMNRYENCYTVRVAAFMADNLLDNLSYEDSFIEVMERNIKKLNKRYGSKWSKENSFEKPDKKGD